MKTIISALLLLTFLLGACSPVFPSTETVPVPPTTSHPVEAIASLTPTDSSCSFQWAYQDLPELSAEFLQAIQALQPGAQVRVFAFGEDCVYTDGSKKFHAMETDFDITLQVNDLMDESELGEWIVNITQIILNIPKEKIMGPQIGRVGIIFQSDDQTQGIYFHIYQYESLSTRLTNAEIYQALKALNK